MTPDEPEPYDTPLPWPTVAAWPLPGDTSTVVYVRALLRGALTVLGLTPEDVGDAELMACELVGNAIKHARGPYELWLRADAGAVVCEVVDGLETLPPMPDGTDPPPDPVVSDALDGLGDLDRLIAGLAEDGRGLMVVRRLSRSRCGAYPTKTRTTEIPVPGKAVWFRMGLGEGTFPSPHKTVP